MGNTVRHPETLGVVKEQDPYRMHTNNPLCTKVYKNTHIQHTCKTARLLSQISIKVVSEWLVTVQSTAVIRLMLFGRFLPPDHIDLLVLAESYGSIAWLDYQPGKDPC